MKRHDPDPQALHLAAWNSIPWLINGSATATQQAAFDRHAATCPACREELAFQQQLRGAIGAAASPAHSPEPALARLNARIAVADSAEGRATPPLRGAAGWRGAGGWTRAWAGVALLQALGIVLLLAFGLVPRSSDPPDAYRTLSDAATPAAAGAPATTLRLVLSARTPAAELPALLSQHGLIATTIGADGSAFGAARRDGAAADAALLAALRADPRLALVEPVLSSPGSAR
jgi:hypothetical protein